MLFEEDIKGNWMQSKNAVLCLNNKTEFFYRICCIFTKIISLAICVLFFSLNENEQIQVSSFILTIISKVSIVNRFFAKLQIPFDIINTNSSITAAGEILCVYCCVTLLKKWDSVIAMLQKKIMVQFKHVLYLFPISSMNW